MATETPAPDIGIVDIDTQGEAALGVLQPLRPHRVADTFQARLRAQADKGYGLDLTWGIEDAKRYSCEQLPLDSGVQRFQAHRLNGGMHIASHHFSTLI